jgi:hydroxymethylglutaryl-CoA synthase
MNMTTIGIDAIALAVPQGYLELADLAAARGVPAGKYVEGLGVRQMAVAAAHEDPVALAANAARRLFAQSGRSPSEIGLCVVGTETAVDHSKPIAAYLHGLLGLPSRCRVFEAKHACFGGTAGLLGAIDWIAAGQAIGSKTPRVALVVCTDVARYGLGTAGEPTQGAGAVAMIISERPRLVELEVGVSGSYARDVHDFWRPLHSKEAVVDGHHSVACYLDALAGAFDAWREASADKNIVRTCYHVPYGKMAKKAHKHRLSLEGREAELDASYEKEVAPSLRFPSLVGNVYTGSLYLALASLLDAEAAQLEGQRIGLFSYGSGCTAEFFSGRVAAGAGKMAAQLALAAPLDARTRLTVPEYEAIRHADGAVDRAPVGTLPAPSLAERTVAYLGIDSDRRVYAN